MLTTAGAQLAPIVTEARTLRQFVAPVHQRLAGVAQNLWWSWDPESGALFRDVDPLFWRQCDHNPIALLNRIDADQLEARASELALHGRINHVYRRMQEYLRSKHTWGARHASVLGARPVAYFSAEFGLHESMPIYSGGLGILAGDHLKSASDLGVPLVGVGLYYDQGYFRQRLDREGWQREEYIDVDSRLLPMQPAVVGGRQVMVHIDTRTGPIVARVWQAAVGRNTLLLLDSNVDGNSPEDRGADRASLRRRWTHPHPAGVVIGRRRRESAGGDGHLARRRAPQRRPQRVCVVGAGAPRIDREGIDTAESLRRVASQIVFTTHTPVPAGHDCFPRELVEEHLGPLRDALGLSEDGLMALGRVHPHDQREEFCMTVLALKTCHRANAVSSLHGGVSRAMWRPLYPGVREEHVPIGHITNGVHVHTWLAPQMRLVYDRHLGTDWMDRNDAAMWEAIDRIDDGELWEAHQTLKTLMIEDVRRRASRAG